MTQPVPSSAPARAEELARLLAAEVRERAALREELLAAYRKQDAQLSRIILLEDVLSRRGVASYAAAKVLGKLAGGNAESAMPRSAAARSKLLAKRTYRKARALVGAAPGAKGKGSTFDKAERLAKRGYRKARALVGAAPGAKGKGSTLDKAERLAKRGYRKVRRTAGAVARKAGLRK